MADYDVEAFIQKRNANKNTIANAGKQAADSMRSVGISSISGKTTTSAAQRIQDQFQKNRDRRRNERGLGGSPVVKEEPPKSSYERLKNMVSNLFSFSGGKLVGGTKETDPSKLYSRSSFVIPAAVAVTATELPPAAVAEQSPYTSPYMRPQPSNRDQSPTSYKFAGARDPYMERRGSPGLMAPPTMDQPDTPGMPDAINRAIASIGAEETADYKIQSGDTLSEIAAATGTTVKELQELNGIKNANRIVAGEDISIPIRRAEDKEVVTKATSMEELKPIKASYTMVNALPPLKPDVSSDTYENPDEMSELEILARTIEKEAGGESNKGKLAVGAVVMNRVNKQTWMGKDVKSVILKPGQFSPWNSYTNYAEGRQGKEMLGASAKPSKASYEAAQKVLSGDYIDPTGGATHFVNPKEKEDVSWYEPFVKNKPLKIGRHQFGSPDDPFWSGSKRPKIRPLGKK